MSKSSRALVAFLWCGAAGSPFAGLMTQGLSPAEQQIIQQVDAHAEEAIQLLERIVNINSGTMNHEGVDEVGLVLRAEFEALEFATRWISLAEANRGGHLLRSGAMGEVRRYSWSVNWIACSKATAHSNGSNGKVTSHVEHGVPGAESADCRTGNAG